MSVHHGQDCRRQLMDRHRPRWAEQERYAPLGVGCMPWLSNPCAKQRTLAFSWHHGHNPFIDANPCVALRYT